MFQAARRELGHLGHLQAAVRKPRSPAAKQVRISPVCQNDADLGAKISMAISGADSLEVPTIYKAYFLGLCKGISH
jgi:hypothetical protein